MKRIFSLLLTFVLILSVLPVPSSAVEAQLIPVESDLPGSDELFAGYVEQLFYEDCSVFGTAAGRQLTGDCKVIYDTLVPVLKEIASGQRSSTIFRIGQAASANGVTYTPEFPAVFTENAPNGKQMLNTVYALLSDLPYELYWFDKTSGFYYSPVVSSSGVLKYVEIGFVAADSYKISNYQTDITKTAAASVSAANARNIVARYASCSDLQKLQGYCQEICALVDYDHNAAYLGNFHTKIDPWQLIYVFDGNPSTNVVCEGYSKAFMYLCDLSSFSGDTVCHTVVGAIPAGTHMWNIVTLEGSNYLADITNCDMGHDLFLAGGTGSVSGGYTVNGLHYTYDSLTRELWGTSPDSILTLSDIDYGEHRYGSWSILLSPGCAVPGKEIRTCSICGHSETRETDPVGHSFGDWIQTTAPTVISAGQEERSCSVCGYTETRSTDILKLVPPVITASINTATGKPRLSWSSVNGASHYRIYRRTSKSGKYSYLKSTSATSFTDSSAEAGINYYYKVRALNLEHDKLSAYSNTVNRACDLEQPEVTMKVQTSTGKPKLVWDKIADASKYRIYRSTQEGSGFSLLETTSSTSYIDDSAKVGKNYYYQVQAIHDNSSANSVRSETVNRVCDLPKPVVTITRSNGSPRLRWSAIVGAEKYYIYRATSKDGEYTHIKTTVTATSYTDTSAEAGTTYYYKVMAVHANSAANSAYSAVKYISAK